LYSIQYSPRLSGITIATELVDGRRSNQISFEEGLSLPQSSLPHTGAPTAFYPIGIGDYFPGLNSTRREAN